jgi:hypothetical protein
MKGKIPFFSVLGESQTYLNIVYILLAFPLSVVYFSLVITGVSLSAGLLVIVIGFFVFMATLMMLKAFRWLDAELTRVFLGRAIPMEKTHEKQAGLSALIKRVFGSTLTWKLFIYYLLIKFPLDTVIWSVSVAFIAITFDLLVVAPLLADYWWYNDELTRWLVDFFGDVYVLPFLGVIWGMISLHVIRGLAWVSREVNVVFLQD